MIYEVIDLLDNVTIFVRAPYREMVVEALHSTRAYIGVVLPDRYREPDFTLPIQRRELRDHLSPALPTAPAPLDLRLTKKGTKVGAWLAGFWDYCRDKPRPFTGDTRWHSYYDKGYSVAKWIAG